MIPGALQSLTADGWRLFLTRLARLFAYGALAVVLVLYLTGIGMSASETGTLLTLTLLGDTAVSLWLTTHADRAGRRRTLIAGALLMAAAGLTFAATRNPLALFAAGTVGVISPSGNEVGPFLSIEQAALAQVVPKDLRTHVFAWYTLTGAFATALGSLFAGVLVQTLQKTGTPALDSERAVLFLYALLGLALAFLFFGLSPATEAPAVRTTHLGLGPSRGPVLKLSSLFALDAFGGGFVVQSFAVYWFHLRFGANPATLGGVFFGANLFAGISALLASRLASRLGLVKTMVFTHLPSNVLLILVPLMPSLPLAIAMLLLRFSISQMDVPTRQSYTMAMVRPEERSAAAGVTGVARTLGAAAAPTFAGRLFAQPSLIGLPFYIAGACKIVYDLLLYRAAAKLPEPEQ